MAHHTPEEKALVIIYKAGGLLSMGGSSLIMRDVWFRFRDKNEVPLTASLVFELSLFDFLSSLFGPFAGTWMVPRETGAYLAAGSIASCTAQGFLNVTFYAFAVLCNASLAIAYCLIVKKGWKDNRANSIGTWLLRCMPLLGLLLSVGPLFDNAYNFAGRAICDISSSPLNCEKSHFECTRGLNAFIFVIFMVMGLVASNIVIIASVSMLIHEVFVLEKKMDNYSPDGQVSRTNTLKTIWQGVWYISAFGIAWWPLAIFYFIDAVTTHPPAFLLMIMVVTWPAQGAYNAMVYFRPKYKSDRERHRDDTRLTSVCRILHFPQINMFSLKHSQRQVVNGDGETVITPRDTIRQTVSNRSNIFDNMGTAAVVGV